MGAARARVAGRVGTLDAGRKIALGVGDLGLNLYWQVASLYLLYYYTDVLGVPPAAAGALYMFALVWDAALDPVIGLVADRTRSRLGRYRPYLLLGSPLLAIGFVAMFAAPAWTTSLGAVIGIATHFLFRGLYALVSVPYAALSARVTRDAGDRADLAAARMLFATAAAVMVATGTLPFVEILAEGRLGWILLSAIYGVAATIILVLTALAARGLDAPTDQPEREIPFVDKMRATAANWPLMLVLAGVATMSFGNTIFQKNLIYYFKYVIGDVRLGGYAMGLLAVAAAVAVPFWAIVARRRGKKQTWLLGLGPSVLGLVLWRLADGHGAPAHLAALALIGVGSAAYVVAFWSMLPDTVEFAEWRTGVRSESFAFGLLMLGQKAALGLGAGALGAGLAAAGYAAGPEQAPQTLVAIKAMMFWAPMAAAAVSALLIAFYPISPALHRRMVAEIAAREDTR